jgi:hypothetical protein
MPTGSLVYVTRVFDLKKKKKKKKTKGNEKNYIQHQGFAGRHRPNY